MIGMICDLIESADGKWSIQYDQSSVRIRHVMNCVCDRASAVQEALRQGFSKITLWKTVDGKEVKTGLEFVPKPPPQVNVSVFTPAVPHQR